MSFRNQKSLTVFIITLVIMTYSTGTSPMSAQNLSKPNLYKLKGASKGYYGQPFRASKNGDVIGELPVSQVYEILAIEGDWAKIKFLGKEYYTWRDRLEKVDSPDIVCSPWAKDWFSYTGAYLGIKGEWQNFSDDWTKPVTKAEIAQMLVVDIMENVYSKWVVQYSLPGAGKNSDQKKFTDSDDYNPGRLLYWGIVPEGKFNPMANLTFGEVTGLLIKLMEYDKKYVREGGGEAFTMAQIHEFKIGGNTSPNAICTKEQAKMLCDKLLLWREEMAHRTEIKHNYGFNDGIFTIQSYLGKNKKNAYLILNNDGKLELSNTQKDHFKVKYKGATLTPYRDLLLLYTIQTMDNNFIGVSGTAKNGNRLISQKAEFIWSIESGRSPEKQWTCFIVSPYNVKQVVNVSAWKTAPGTPVITWYWKEGKGDDSNNCKFIFSKVE